MKRKYIILAALLLASCAAKTDTADTVQTEAQTSSVTEADTSAADTAADTTTADTTAAETAPTAEETTAAETTTEETTTADTSIKPGEWLDAYRSKVEEITSQENEDYQMCDMFSLYDMTHDGIPELIVSTGGWHGGGAMIFTYRDGDVHQYSCPWDDEYDRSYPDQVAFGSNGVLAYTEDGGYIVSSYTGSGATDASVFTFGVGDRLDKIFTSQYYTGPGAMSDDSHDYTVECKINGEDCTKEELLAAAAPYEKRSYIQLGRDYVLSHIILESWNTDSAYKTFEDVAREIEEGTFRQMYDDLHFYPADALPDYDLPEGCDVLKVFKVYDHDYAYAAKDGKAQLMDLTNGKSYDIPGLGDSYSYNYNAYIIAKDGKIFLKADETKTEQFREFVFSLTDSSIVLDRSIPSDEHDWNDEYHQYYSESMIDLCPIYFCWDMR